jgi:hypothetical protein
MSPLSPLSRDYWVGRRNESSTFKRLGTSQHVTDLRVIALITALSMILVPLLAHYFDIPMMTGKDTATGKHTFTDEGFKFVAGLAAVGSGVLAWAYQAGSRRLGVVDLFACEIVTLCRVGTIVDIIPNLIDKYGTIGLIGQNMTSLTGSNPPASGQSSNISRFNSQEEYFPVFQSNSKDLEILEAPVVNNVTAFYTYMKAVRDYLRLFEALKAAAAPPDEQGKAMLGVIFMVFLAYESARRAIDDLIEYEPTHAEFKIVVLLTEIPAYRFLLSCGKFEDEDDVRQIRLQQRYKYYEPLVQELQAKVLKNKSDERWEKPYVTLPSLERAYKEAFGPLPVVDPAPSWLARIWAALRHWLSAVLAHLHEPSSSGKPSMN